MQYFWSFCLTNVRRYGIMENSPRNRPCAARANKKTRIFSDLFLSSSSPHQLGRRLTLPQGLLVVFAPLICIAVGRLLLPFQWSYWSTCDLALSELPFPTLLEVLGYILHRSLHYYLNISIDICQVLFKNFLWPLVNKRVIVAGSHSLCPLECVFNARTHLTHKFELFIKFTHNLLPLFL